MVKNVSEGDIYNLFAKMYFVNHQPLKESKNKLKTNRKNLQIKT